MKKKIKIIILLVLLFAFIYVYYISFNNQNNFIINETPFVEGDKYEEKVSKYQEEFNNKDVKAILYIANTDFMSVVLQGEDNDYYLNHYPDKSYNINGSVFFDYRIDINNTQKIIIYGHSSPNYDLPIEVIENYSDKTYANSHKYIYLDTKEEHRTFEVLGSYVETKDWSYTKVDFENEEVANKHFHDLLKNSFYKLDNDINGNDTMLIIQTCSNLSDFKNFKNKYFLLLAKEIFN